MLSIDDIKALPFFQALTAMDYVDAIYATGSYALGTEHANSDIDLSILCPGATDEEWDNIVNMAENTETLVPIEVWRLDTLPMTLFKKRMTSMMRPLYVRPLYFDKSIIFDRMQVIHSHIETLRKRWNAGKDENLTRDFHILFMSLCTLARRCQKLHGMHCRSPRSVLREAYRQGWFADHSLWENMLDDATLAFYDKETSDLPVYLDAMTAAMARIEQDMAYLKDPAIHSCT